MKEVLKKLLTVKSIVTIAMNIVFCVLALKGAVTSEQFIMIFTTVVAFYFGTQAEKKSKNAEETKEVSQTE